MRSSRSSNSSPGFSFLLILIIILLIFLAFLTGLWLCHQGGQGNPPVISGVTLGNYASSSIPVSWQTDKFSDTEVIYSKLPLASSTTPTVVKNTNLTKNHEIFLPNLEYNPAVSTTPYYFMARSTDIDGRTAESAEYTFEFPLIVKNIPWSNPPNNRTIPMLIPGDIIDEPLSLFGPAGMTITDNGLLYVADNENDKVLVYDADDLHFIRYLGDYGPAIHKPWDVAVDSSGNSYVVAGDSNNRTVCVFDPLGHYLNQYFSMTWSLPGIAVGYNDFIYVSGLSTRVIDSISNLTYILREVGLENYFPVNIAIDKNNRVYFSNQGICNDSGCDLNNSITIQDPAGKFKGKTSLDYKPGFIDIDNWFRIWVADPENNRLRVYDSEGVYIDTVYLPMSPTGVEINGNTLFVSSMEEGTVRTYTIQ